MNMSGIIRNDLQKLIVLSFDEVKVMSLHEYDQKKIRYLDLHPHCNRKRPIR